MQRMDSLINNTSDQNILSMIVVNNSEAWSILYDKYAPAMYGIICNLTEDETLAEEIFKEAFLQLRDKQILTKNTYPLCPFLLRHTHTFARQQLKERKITSAKNQIEETSLINILCSQHLTIKELALKLNLTEEDVKRKVRAEFLELRSQSTEEKPSQHHQVFKDEYAENSNSTNQI